MTNWAIWRPPGATPSHCDAGCRYLQLDDTVWAYLCSDDQRRQIRERGDDADELAHLSPAVLNKALERQAGRSDHRPAYQRFNLDFRKAAMSRWRKVLFGTINVDAFFLEYDNDHNGDFTIALHSRERQQVRCWA